jgi:dienelactone hydrolase
MAGAYTGLTGAPIHILAGGKDRHDDPDTCQRFIDALPPAASKAIALTVFPNATHVWDVGRSYRYFDRFACKGAGCDIDVVFDPDVTQKGRQIVLDFFSTSLIRSKER